MPKFPDDLSTLKDDMVAFTEGHGMRRFSGYVDHEEVQTVMWKESDDSEGWKDFVELAKASGAPFVIMDSWQLEKEELEGMIQRLSKMAKFVSVRQAEARGLGHAVLCARAAVGDEPFAVLLGDDLLEAERPGLRQLIDNY